MSENNFIEKFKGFKAELAIAETFEEIKNIETRAAAAAEFAKKSKIALDAQNQWGRFRVEIEQKKGSWLEKNFPGKINKDKKKSILDNSICSGSMKDQDIKSNESANARLVNKENELANDVMDEIEQKKKEITPNAVSSEIRKKNKKTKIKEQKADLENQEKPKGPFDVVVIDPPWNYGRKYDPEGSRVASPYPEMAQEELKNLKIPFAENCVLWLWTTHQFLWDAKELLDEWDFTYKATLVWNKENIGMGKWLRMQIEFCLLGIKGKPYFNNTSWRDIITEKRREHSRKPDTFYKMVKNICAGEKIDWFAREPREGWKTYGNETNKFK